ncbi:hypothetical protein CEUSTIGMA_g11734.t1 [Chlamydomonas eustigma]|uniref:Uncharacterized protein n=1 Tax=Chlamydomonas eustigma TaxID=1157962 RepID=A0A250XN25_9CHLO|nr:hypothetical protein CEUSTIGMA_g11734.t1 [Chlamydomonas eustigma]|eukprot:GAX84312.1 hypothetical protein CEUSTIGMA_g11734.t1 [Chlamydomonas eustigma]
MNQNTAGPPISILYLHFHNAIRSALEEVQLDVRSLENLSEPSTKLLELRERCRFLEQVHLYHSSVEDEVVYPALDSKVKNVTKAYTHEHRDEELLLEQLLQQIGATLSCQGSRTEAIRALICKVEEIHTTLKKHLAKEEEQLLPLLVSHFTPEEQAELIAQFLYSIPLATVEKVLSWLKPTVPEVEQAQLLMLIRTVVPDSLILQLLSSWLRPTAAAAAACTTQIAQQLPLDNAAPPVSSCSVLATGFQPESWQALSVPKREGGVMTSTRSILPECCGNRQACEYQAASCCHDPAGCSTSVPPPPVSLSSHGDTLALGTTDPLPAGHLVGSSSMINRPAALKDILHIHNSICSALYRFREEISALRYKESADVGTAKWNALVEKYRFLRSVCLFHTASEEEVMYPAVRQLMSQAEHASVVDATMLCTHEHEAETSLLEELGRLLADVRALVRRGRKEVVAGMLERLYDISERVCGSMEEHMRREEVELFPLLEKNLCEAQQCSILWMTLRAMPLRLLEKVMPWIAAELSDAEADVLLRHIHLGAPPCDTLLVQLLSQWARRGRQVATSHENEFVIQAAGVVLNPSGVIRGPHVSAGIAASSAAPTSLYMAEAAADSPSAAAAAGGSMESAASSHAPFLCALPEHDAWEEVDGGTFPSSSHQERERTRGHYWNVHNSGKMQPSSCELRLLRRRSEASGTSAGEGVGEDVAAAECCGRTGCQGLFQQEDVLHPRSKRQRLQQSDYTSTGANKQPSQQLDAGTAAGFNPIDHIFQFHKALKQELYELEQDASHLEAVVIEACQNQPDSCTESCGTERVQIVGSTAMEMQSAGSTFKELDFSMEPEDAHVSHAPCQTSTQPHALIIYSSQITPEPAASSLPKACTAAVQQLGGRFQFLWGIYQAHSRSEDEIVFPALESKQALRNVSHAYTLDHQQEEQLFIDLDQVINRLKTVGSADDARVLALDVRRMCAAIRASLETHVRSEESELWPLFAEHFTFDEQQYLVGVIIGRTGAQVLQTLLPWISESFSEEEKDAMMDSLRQVAKNTMFDQWLGAVRPTNTQQQQQQGTVDVSGKSMGGCKSAAEDDKLKPLTEVAEYLIGINLATDKSAAEHDDHSRAEESAMGNLVGGSSCGEGSHVLNSMEVEVPKTSAHNHVTWSAAAATTMDAGMTPAAARTSASSQVPDPKSSTGAGPLPLDASGTFRPGWEDIFRMNQKQLEAAIHKVSKDSSLEPGHKAYLIQNIMVRLEAYLIQNIMVRLEAYLIQNIMVRLEAYLIQNIMVRLEAYLIQNIMVRLEAYLIQNIMVRLEAYLIQNIMVRLEAYLIQNIMVSRYIVAQQKRMQEEPSQLLGTLPQQHAETAASACSLHPKGHDVLNSVLPGHPTDSVPCSTSALPVIIPRTYHSAQQGVLGCKHYQRKCQLVAPCCNKPFTCRLCHDESSSHRMDRHAVKDMVCMECGVRGPVGQSCASCCSQLAAYYCDICHLFDDDTTHDIYHCPFCNICRRGRGLGVDFFHCMDCNACMSLSLFKAHVCRSKAMEADCPVCSECLFDSVHPVKELPCGHLMHSSCFATYIRYNYTCPLCTKSIGDMTVYFQMLDSLLASERLPAEYAGRTQMILCNDCGKSGFAPFHFVYHSCPHCRSYNTRVT